MKTTPHQQISYTADSRRTPYSEWEYEPHLCVERKGIVRTEGDDLGVDFGLCGKEWNEGHVIADLGVLLMSLQRSQCSW